MKDLLDILQAMAENKTRTDNPLELFLDMSERVVKYVANQEAHHRSITFQDELRAFLKQHGIAYDETYLWG